ncbi:MAG: NAD(P)-binding protein [Deltaproteobacteria bacterium]|nr:NAD(P)-binding protein [Deltaproteobacteria bacterium]
MIAILGAGVAGLAAASTLENLGKDYVVIEKEPRIGGYSRSFKAGKFTFDFSGHLLHVNNKRTKELLAEKCPDLFDRHDRSAEIWIGDKRVPFPFQANLYHLGPQTARRVLASYERARKKGTNRKPFKPADSFKAFVTRTFGIEMARMFFIPYNQKLFSRSLTGITTKWTTWSVPKPSAAEIRRGALGDKTRSYGYNASFLYPSQGSIEELPKCLAKGTRNVRIDSEAVRIDLEQKTIELSSGENIGFSSLISTIPLPSLLRILDPRPKNYRRWHRALSASKMLVLNLGVKGPAPTGSHWIYFPEHKWVFLRVGFYTNFAPHLAPGGCHSMYVEIGCRGGCVNEKALIKRAECDLVSCGILSGRNNILEEHCVVMDPAYVDYTRSRERALPEINRFLAKHRIKTAGRYGRWEYGSMDSSMAQGIEASEKSAADI